MMFRREPQIGGRALAIGQHDLHRCRVGGRLADSERGQPGIDQFDQPRTGLGFWVLGVEHGPVAVADLGLHRGRYLGQYVAKLTSKDQILFMSAP